MGILRKTFNRLFKRNANNSPRRPRQSGVLFPARAIIAKDLQGLRKQSRTLYRENAFVSKFTNGTISDIIGRKGYILQCQSKNDNGKQDELANDAIERDWKKWTQDAEISGMKWQRFSRMALQSLLIDGEVFVRAVYDKNNNLKIHLLDAEMVPTRYTVHGQNIFQGIQYDEWGKPVKYFVKKTKDFAASLTYPTNADLIEVSSNDMFHIANIKQIWQGRGEPFTAPVIQQLLDLDAYMTATLENAQATAKTGGFIKNEQATELTGNEVNDFGEQVIDMSGSGTSFIHLKGGQEFTTYNPTFPENQFKEYVKIALQSIASGLETSYHSLANDLESVNYSSLRDGTIKQREVYQKIQDTFIEELYLPLYKKWLQYALLNGIVVPNGILNAKNLAKYENAIFIARTWAWVDPSKDVKATVDEINAGIRSRKSVILSQGGDPEKVYEEILDEQQRDKKNNLNFLQSKKGNKETTNGKNK